MNKILRQLYIISFISIFLLSPVLFYLYQKNYVNINADVKGISTSLPSEDGTYINVVSKFGNWDLYKYLCKDLDNCISLENNGEYWGIVSGGDTTGYVYKIDSTKVIDEEYKYIKVFVKSSWGSLLRVFEPTIISNNKQIKSYSIVNESQEYNVVIIPIESIDNTTSNIIQFSD